MTNGLSHPYHLDESTFILGAAGVTFHFLFCILLYIHRQWNRTVYHGGGKDVPGSRRYRPDAVPVETRFLPASSRFTTVHVFELFLKGKSTITKFKCQTVRIEIRPDVFV